ncbi:MAG: large subunit ribosomal protein, partial [Actinomycetota bacterium]|nr:large subunit ribosomal protein [Actinomycetota bacterium]
MPIRRSKPTSPGRRFQSHSDYKELTRTTGEKSLLEPKHRKGGRNNRGRVTARHQGGGNKVR